MHLDARKLAPVMLGVRRKIMEKEGKQKYEIYNHQILWITAHKNLTLSRTSEDDALFIIFSRIPESEEL